MYTVLNQVSGKSFQCEGDETVLDGALSNGFNFPYGCQNGFCGQCKAVILNGEIDYAGPTPEAISEDDRDANIALLCQCKAKSDLYIAVDELDSLANIQIRSMPCRVEEVNHLNHDVIQLILKIPGSQSLQYFRLYPHIEDTIYHIHIRLLCNNRASVYKVLILTRVSTICWRTR